MKFDTIRDALRHVVDELIPREHKYILSVRGPKEIHYNKSCCFQVVAETMPCRNCEFGLTIHLPFDPSSGVTEQFLKFLECPIRHHFEKYVWEGIPIFYLRCGEDNTLAESVMKLLLIEVYEYTSSTKFECDVSDEGQLDDDDDDDVDHESDDEDEEDESEDDTDEESAEWDEEHGIPHEPAG